MLRGQNSFTTPKIPEIGKFKNKFQIKVIRFWIIWRDTSSFTSSSTLKYANIVDGCIPFGEIAKHIDCIHGKAMLHLESHFCNLHHYKIRSFALKCICICMCALSVCALWLESIFITFAVCHQPTKPKQPTDRVARTHTHTHAKTHALNFIVQRKANKPFESQMHTASSL